MAITSNTISGLAKYYKSSANPLLRDIGNLLEHVSTSQSIADVIDNPTPYNTGRLVWEGLLEGNGAASGIYLTQWAYGTRIMGALSGASAGSKAPGWLAVPGVILGAGVGAAGAGQSWDDVWNTATGGWPQNISWADAAQRALKPSAGALNNLSDLFDNPPASPLILDLDGSGDIELISLSNSTTFFDTRFKEALATTR